MSETSISAGVASGRARGARAAASSASDALRAIIAPGTDPDIVERYLTLASRAAEYDFGLLEEDVVVLDTETTGLDFKSCELIEIAAARLRGREIVDSFDVFVRPTSPIPAEIVQLTHITNEMVADAPLPGEAIAAFEEFIGDAPLIAHNVAFDRHFLEKAAGHRVGSAWVDSLELSRIALPCLTSHKLADLSRAFGLTASTHRADADVEATCGLWRVLLTATSDLPAGLLNYLANLYPEVPWSYRPIFAQLAAAYPDLPFSLVDERVERCGKQDLTARVDARVLGEQGLLSFPDPDEVAREYASDGIVGRMYEGYEPRSEQVTMAREVTHAFSHATNAAIEAGTGVGKSMAYLLPAALLARRNGITVGVATKSNALTDQLMRHELPLLSKALETPLEYVALKGYDNYPCLRKVERLARLGSKRRRGSGVAGDDAADLAVEDDPALGAEEGPETDATAGSEAADQAQASAVTGRATPAGVPAPSEDLLNAIAAIYSFATQSAQGDLNTLGIRWGKVKRGDLTSTSAECQKRRCPYFPNSCFLHGARRRAAASDIVVTNHSLLFRAIGSDVDILPPIRYWVVDEAHAVEGEARRQWALHVNSREVTAGFERLGSMGSGAIGALSKEAQGSAGATLMLGALSRTASEASAALVTSTAFFDDVRRMAPRQSRRGGYEVESIWLSDEVRGSEAFAAVRESGSAFFERLDKVVKQGQDAVKTLAEETSSGRSQNLTDRIDELSGAIGPLRDTRDALGLILDGTDKRYVYSVGIDRRSGAESYEMTAELLDVGSEIAKRWYPEAESVVYASATIAVGEEFTHFNHEVGFDALDRDEYRTLRLSSSYDFERNMNVLVARDMPEPNNPAYLGALERLLVDVHLGMGGSVLTLFTNRREMEQMYELVEPVLAQRGQMLLCQNRGSNVRLLREKFIAEQGSSLFALKSFWEGFDAAGDTLRCVVIPKLPFQRPTDPVSCERDVREDRAWARYSLPEAVLAVKQAAGRLIRTSTDRGCLVLADARLLSKGYGKVFLGALPKKDYERVSVREVRGALEGWCERNDAW